MSTAGSKSDPMLSLTTDGLCAQSIIDKCNAINDHFGGTDWALSDPDPELARDDRR